MMVCCGPMLGSITSRSRSQAAQLASRDLLIRIESRRSSESSMSVGLKRMSDQRAQTVARGAELEAALADGDLPIVDVSAPKEVTP